MPIVSLARSAPVNTAATSFDRSALSTTCIAGTAASFAAETARSTIALAVKWPRSGLILLASITRASARSTFTSCGIIVAKSYCRIAFHHCFQYLQIAPGVCANAGLPRDCTLKCGTCRVQANAAALPIASASGVAAHTGDWPNCATAITAAPARTRITVIASSAAPMRSNSRLCTALLRYCISARTMAISPCTSRNMPAWISRSRSPGHASGRFVSTCARTLRAVMPTRRINVAPRRIAVDCIGMIRRVQSTTQPPQTATDPDQFVQGRPPAKTVQGDDGPLGVGQ